MKRFKRIYVEITNICNLSCSFCPATKRTPEFISPALFTKILDDIKPFTDYIYLHIKGEPFMHPQIGLLLDIAYEKGLNVNITTNGTIPIGDLIYKPALRQINFSLHSNENISYDSTKEYLMNIFETAKNGVDKNNICFLEVMES
jgi:MoaA/NifB/PqqE/SkfB family radical SAM enzyme